MTKTKYTIITNTYQHHHHILNFYYIPIGYTDAPSRNLYKLRTLMNSIAQMKKLRPRETLSNWSKLAKLACIREESRVALK